MRLTILTLFVCAGTTAFCQSTAQNLSISDKFGLTPPAFNLSGPQAANIPGDQISHIPALNPFLPNARSHLVLPSAEPTQRRNDAQIDQEMIVHPAHSNMDVQQPGTPIAKNQFPNLTFLPIESGGKPLPTQWLNAKIENTPTRWPSARLINADSDRSAAAPAPAK